MFDVHDPDLLVGEKRMTVAKIHGAEFPVSKIFSNDFNFSIPLYQRPYAWTTEQAGELLDDFLEFIEPNPANEVGDLSPYFLGSIVLIKREGDPNAEVVDGQQRLTTLHILMAALRHSIEDRTISTAMTKYLYEQGDPIEGNPNRYRLTLRERDAEFFRRHVQDEAQIVTLMEMNPGQLSDSQRNIRANAILFLKKLTKIPDRQRVRLAQFIVKNCLLVVVSTPDLDSAYRIFSILNDRGLDLSHADILKSEIIGKIPDKEEQNIYNERWEDAEEELGRDAFGDLFAHTRMIHRKQKGRESVLKEFREYVISEVGDSKELIDDVLIPYADAFALIQTASYESTEGAEEVNRLLKWLNRIDNMDWVPPAILYLARNKSNPKLLYRFLADLERLAAFLMICRYGINDRIERYGRLLGAIEKKNDLYSDGSPLQLSEDECRQFAIELDGEVYRQVPKRRLYTLLRLDSTLSDGSATFDHSVLTIEHVLPQNPKLDSQWCDWFPTRADRERWVHRLGNLLLLNHRKNSSASNYDFAKKKSAYFLKGGVSPFPLTTQALTESEWTEEVLERRQSDLIDKLKELWRIDVEMPVEPCATTVVEERSLISKKARQKLDRITVDAVRMLWLRTGRRDDAFSRRRKRAECLEFAERHPKMLDCVRLIYGKNADGDIARYLAPGYSAALLYLMGSSRTKRSDNRTANEQDAHLDESQMNWSMWDQACSFWGQLATNAETVKPLREALRMVDEGDGITIAERCALIVKAWKLYADGQPITSEGLELEYETEDYGIAWLRENPVIGGIDVGDQIEEE